jgi:hypothetical protein
VIFTPLGTSPFTGTDNLELGPTWDGGYTGGIGFIINTNRARGGENTPSIERFNTVQASADQYAQAQLSTWGPSNQFGPTVRMASPSTTTMYLGLISLFSPDHSNEIYKIIANSYTQLAEDTTDVSWTALDTVKTAVLGTGVYLFKNGTEVLTASDSDIASGYSGMWAVSFPSFVGRVDVDNFEMGDVDPDEGGFIAAWARNRNVTIRTY